MEKTNLPPISTATIHRMPIYLRCLHQMKESGRENVSSVAIADVCLLNASVVKKDLSYVIKTEGKPKIGYAVNELIADIEDFLGYNNTKDAILVGVGKLGQALLGYNGFQEQGFNIIAGFDINDAIIGSEIAGKKILPTGKIESVVKKLNIMIGVIATPKEHAQAMADALVRYGIRAIWNFTPEHLIVPSSVVVKNENMAASLSILSQQLKELLEKETI